MPAARANLLAHSIRLVLCGVFSLPGIVQAQDLDEDPVELDRISVTGSRIKRVDLASASPLVVIHRNDIERSGQTSLGDLLQDLTIAGSALNTQVNNGNSGFTYLDLRNLGPRRLLVLINGRRTATSLNGRVDLNNIPVAIIKRIEILKDGASAIYGSDAISGVVNIITRDDFEGLQANASFGQFESENDGEIQAYDFSVGTNSERGSVFFNASYTKAEDVMAGDRVISAEPLYGTGNAFGSSGTPQGRFGAAFLGSWGLTTDPGANVTGPGGIGAAAFRPGDFSTGAPGDGADRFNFAPDNYLLTPQERTNIFTQGKYDVTDEVRLSVEATFNNRKSNQQLAPVPLFLGLFGFGLASGIGVAADNIYNPFGQELLASSWLLGRRMTEAGPRASFQDIDSYRFGLGFEGSFELLDRYFDWDVNYIFNEIKSSYRSEGSMNMQRVQEALGGQPCRDDVNGNGCVELNVFGGQGPDGLGTITPEMLNFIQFTGHHQTGAQLRNYAANLTGDLLELPAGPLGFAAGYEYRQTEGFISPDALTAAGITSGLSLQPTSGSTAVDEFFVEFAVPILSAVTGAERLDLSLAARWSDYDTFGSTINSKLGIEWQPIDDLLLRATYSEGFRAPNISELFAGQLGGLGGGLLIDPCVDMLGIYGGDPQPQDVVDNCIAQGVPADGSLNFGVNQVTSGSNPNLMPETSESITFGVVYSPGWLDGLDIAIDFYDIELENTISDMPPQTILNACANTLSLCHLIQRSSTQGVAAGRVTNLLAAGINLGGTEVEGVDFLVSYSFPENDFGFFRVVWDSAYQSTNSDSVPDVIGGGPDIIMEHIGFNFGDSVFARWKSNLDINWSYANWEATWGMQYIHGSTEDCWAPEAFGFCNETDNNGNFNRRKIGATTYHDMQVSYHLSEYDTRFTFGIQNVGDKGPPLSTSAFANSFGAGGEYRTPGRFPYVRVTMDF